MVFHCLLSCNPNLTATLSCRCRSFFFRSPFFDQITPSFPTVVCFREDDSPISDAPFPPDAVIPVPRAISGVKYGPWAVGMVHVLNRPPPNPTTGGPGGGRVGDRGGGGGDGGGDDDEEEERGDEGEDGKDAFLLPVLTVGLASVHLGYCVGVWARDEELDVQSLRTGVGLFCLLLLSALRLKCHSGLGTYIRGLASSTSVMVWTGERCFVKKESTAAGFVSLLAASMSLTFSAALYNSV